MPKFTSIEGLFNQAEQSVGPYIVDEEETSNIEPMPSNPPVGFNPMTNPMTGTLSPQGQWSWNGVSMAWVAVETEGNIGSSELIVFQPEKGIDITYKNPIVNNDSTEIIEDRDGRKKLGTLTLNNRDFWENINFNEDSFQPFLIEDKETVKTSVIKDGNGDDIVTKEINSTIYEYSIDALPFVTNPNDGDEIIRVDRYWDKKINLTEHYLATEGKINYYIYPRADGRLESGNIDLFSPRGLKTSSGGKNRFTTYAEGPEGTGYYLFKLNWGDGSPLEHTTEPKLMEGTTLLDHIYEKPGFYTISGVIYASYKGEKIDAYEQFETNILLNASKNYEFDLYNYETFANIGSMSDNSVLIKSTLNTIGVNPITKDASRTDIEFIDKVNDFDKLELLNFINKISSTILTEDFYSFYQPYNLKIKDLSNSTIHNGFIDDELFDTFKDNGLNNFDLATTKIYKGVKPMWEQLGFESDDSDIPTENIYWKNIIPSDYTFLNKSGITIEDGDNPLSGSRVPRIPYKEVIINQDDEQIWDDNYYYPNLPKLNRYGIFVEEVNIENSYGIDTAPITDLEEADFNLTLNLDLEQADTDGIIDKTNFNTLEYIQDFKLLIDDDFRIKTNTFLIPDGIEKNKDEQAF